LDPADREGRKFAMAIFLLRGQGAEGAIEADLRAKIPGLIEVASFNRIIERKSVDILIGWSSSRYNTTMKSFWF
jgi:hypothetical protein